MNPASRTLRLLLVCGGLAGPLAGAQTIPVPANLWRLVAQEDTDGDRKITILDHTTPFELRDDAGVTVRVVAGEYPLSVLMQELKRAEDRHAEEIAMTNLPLDESVVDRTHRLIRDYYWDALTRRIDGGQLNTVVADAKVKSKYDYLYVPGSDPVAVKYFQALAQSGRTRDRSPALRVVVLPPPEKIDGDFVRRLDGSHGLLSLRLEQDAQGRPVRGAPYVVPGGRFNELYYWDSYFMVLGLLQDGRPELARSTADNLLYEEEHYGIIPNANRTYYLTRSQPPFLTSIIRAVYEAGAADKHWLAAALKTALAEYQQVWLGRERLVKIGPYELSRYHDAGNGPCPEVEPGHYDDVLQPWLTQVNANGSSPAVTPFRFLNEYLYCGEHAGVQAGGLTLDEFFQQDRAVRESGHDTTHRFDDRTADFVSVDLNSLLYKYETDFAALLEQEFGGRLPALGPESGTAAVWRDRAARRKQAMMALMWNDQRGYFFDYDFVRQQRSAYISATGLYPLWAKLLAANDSEERERARRTAAFACAELEQLAGLAATARESVETAGRQDERQWDFPYGWAPHQMLAWQGLKNYGLDADAGRLAYRWLFAIVKSAHDFNGTIPEKYNVVTGSHAVFAEYGNVGTKFDYIAPEGFGWMNASFEVGLNSLSPAQRVALEALQPPPAK